MTAENVTIQDLLTSLLYWRSKAKEYKAQRDMLLGALPEIVRAEAQWQLEVAKATHA